MFQKTATQTKCELVIGLKITRIIYQGRSVKEKRKPKNHQNLKDLKIPVKRFHSLLINGFSF